VPVDERVLFVPAALLDSRTRGLRDGAAVHWACCATVQDLVVQACKGAAVLVIREDALAAAEHRAQLAASLSDQEPWSQVPVLLLCARGADAPLAHWAAEALPGAFILELPIRPATLASAVRCAVDARRRQYELRDGIARLRENEQRKDQFLATLAHELRSPLAPLSNAIRLARLPGAEGAIRERALHIMERQLHSLVRLVDDLLDVSRITRATLELRKEEVALASVLANAVETVRPLLEANRQRLTLQQPDADLCLQADAVRLTQVFVNLLDNAAKYSAAGSEILVRVEGDADEVCVHVCDHGIGIRAEAMAAIFEPFEKGDPPGYGCAGLGIGLTLARELARMHGGEISVHSAGPGEGADFLVRLPRLPARPAPALEFAPAHARILVADDNVDSAESLGLMLRLMGNEVRVAYDGSQALQEAGAFRPDVIVLDIGMPRLNGYDTARRIRELPWGKEVLLAALTGWGQAEDKRRAAEAGFDCHFTKPVTPDTLTELTDRITHRGT
jgi:signal transduction histidine kinase/CheY-like chemotaxis protein